MATAGPGDVGRVIRVVRSVKTVHDQREWLAYLRREAVVRALNSRGGIVTEEIGEAADQICEVLDRTDIPFEPADGMLNRATRWTREKVTRGVRFPEYTGPQGETFLERLGRWIHRAAGQEAVEEALNRASFPAGEHRRRLFAVAVVQEVRGLLSESRRPEGQNRVRFRMANSIFNGTSDGEIRAHHAKWRLFVQSVVAGVVAGLSADFVFDIPWQDALGFGTTVAFGNAVRDAAQSGLARLGPDVAAFRGEVVAWLRRLPERIVRRVEWSEPALKEGVMASETPLLGLLDALDRGGATIGEAERDDPDLADLEDLIRAAGEIDDRQARAHLIRARRALRYDPAAIPAEFTGLILFLEDEGEAGGHAVRAIPPPRPPLDPGRQPSSDDNAVL
ncbi:hypothetical protein [Streptomyces lavendulocolor]|uniref:hypothetical protein n=1 Tax=Streptomyces lavendulocolor TaxID=67316 RepID=UPI0031D2B593